MRTRTALYAAYLALVASLLAVSTTMVTPAESERGVSAPISATTSPGDRPVAEVGAVTPSLLSERS